ncbi:MAG TPA: creatininase family protein [Alphaproteobacteria bacterium]|nr:creatininase family protein [Alphaproteobacteria bacterium]
MAEIEWARLKAAELAQLAKRNAIVILPIGSTEQHGPHLPTQVDSRLATEVAHRAARIMADKQPTIVTPTIPFGMSEHHMSLNGTITLDYATMAAVLSCACESILRHGFKRIFILNGHGGNTDGIYTFITEFTVKHRVPLAGGTYWNIAQKEIADILEKQKALLHACEAETAMMLALTPELIDRDELSQMHGAYVPGLAAIPGVNAGVYRWRQLSSRSPIGVIGDAGAATPEKGVRLFEAISGAVARALLEERLWSEPI